MSDSMRWFACPKVVIEWCDLEVKIDKYSSESIGFVPVYESLEALIDEWGDQVNVLVLQDISKDSDRNGKVDGDEGE